MARRISLQASAADMQVPGPSRPIRQDRSRKSLERILTAAERLLRGQGLAEFSVAGVAAASGVSIGGIYARVQGKGELLLLLKEHAIGQIHAHIERSLRDPQPSLAAAADLYVDGLVRLFSRDQALHRALFTAGDSTAELGRRGFQTRRRTSALVLDAFGRADPRVAALPHDIAFFGVDLAPIIILQRLRDTGAPGPIDWPILSRNIKLAVKSYFSALLAEG